MAPNPQVAKAFRAMKGIGIPEEKVKPVLKNLLKLYEKNWELIEAENYRVLADAIFETDEMEARSCFLFLCLLFFECDLFNINISILLCFPHFSGSRK